MKNRHCISVSGTRSYTPVNRAHYVGWSHCLLSSLSTRADSLFYRIIIISLLFLFPASRCKVVTDLFAKSFAPVQFFHFLFFSSTDPKNSCILIPLLPPPLFRRGNSRSFSPYFPYPGFSSLFLSLSLSLFLLIARQHFPALFVLFSLLTKSPTHSDHHPSRSIICPLRQYKYDTVDSKPIPRS